MLGAVIGALFVAGVFGGDDPASSPRVAVPADPPAQRTPEDVVIVPGTERAGPDDVESAKARERARAERSREAAAAPERERENTATAPAATAPAATAPPARAPAPPPPPPAAADRERDGSRKVDAGNGATGAEQIPPAKDTSTVPDLAPPPEPATAP